jgi:hypothetical protein
VLKYGIFTNSNTFKGKKRPAFLSMPVSLLITTASKCGPVLRKDEEFQNTSTF